MCPACRGHCVYGKRCACVRNSIAKLFGGISVKSIISRGSLLARILALILSLYIYGFLFHFSHDVLLSWLGFVFFFFFLITGFPLYPGFYKGGLFPDGFVVYSGFFPFDFSQLGFFITLTFGFFEFGFEVNHNFYSFKNDCYNKGFASTSARCMVEHHRPYYGIPDRLRLVFANVRRHAPCVSSVQGYGGALVQNRTVSHLRDST